MPPLVCLIALDLLLSLITRAALIGTQEMTRVRPGTL